MVLTTTRRGAADWVVSIHPQRIVGSHDPAGSGTRHFASSLSTVPGHSGIYWSVGLLLQVTKAADPRGE